MRETMRVKERDTNRHSHTRTHRLDCDIPSSQWLGQFYNPFEPESSQTSHFLSKVVICQLKP